MKINKILEHKKNPLLNREEIIAVLESIVTPSLKQVAELVSEKLGKPVENIVVSNVLGQFGSSTFKVSAKVYSDHKSREKYEVVTRKHRRKLADEKKKGEEAKKAEEAAKQSTNTEGAE